MSHGPNDVQFGDPELMNGPIEDARVSVLRTQFAGQQNNCEGKSCGSILWLIS